MFFPPPDEELPQQNITKSRKSRKKRKKKNPPANNVKKEILKKKNRLVLTMSTWAEHFTIAATWQLKHQLAHWKARAKSLEYENKILHDIIRKNCMDTDRGEHSGSAFVRNNPVENEYSYSESEKEHSEQEEEYSEQYEEECSEGNEEEFEVSEEFIQFLKENAKYKEEAKLERERLKAMNEEINDVQEMEMGPSEPRSNNSTEFKDLYGANWQRIAALEMSIQSQFINESDKSKTSYWPNIPFNFG